MLDPETNVVTYRGFIRYNDSSFFNLVTDCTAFMDEIHKVKLLGLKENWRSRGYLSASDFTSMASIFRRYKVKLITETLPELNQRIMAAFEELSAFSKRHQELLTEMQKQANTGNVITVKRPENKSRHVEEVVTATNYRRW